MCNPRTAGCTTVSTERMARLIVNTFPALNHIAAFVANQEGMPALGLEATNFRVRPTIAGADGSLLAISDVTPSKLPGFYIVNLERSGSTPPRRGLHVFELIVEKGEDAGQALASVVMA